MIRFSSLRTSTPHSSGVLPSGCTWNEQSDRDALANRHAAGRLQEYQVIGRHLPTDTNPTPKLYRMRIFAPNTTVAKSRFWYFLQKLRKVKKANGEIVSLNVVSHADKLPTKPGTMLMDIRFMKNDLRRSKTSASGFAMIPVLARTTCTKNTGKCRERMLLRLCTRIWLLVTVLALGPSTYVLYTAESRSVRLICSSDPQSRGAREDRRRQATLPQAASSKEPEIPSTTQSSPFKRQEALLTPQAIDIRVNYNASPRCR